MHWVTEEAEAAFVEGVDLGVIKDCPDIRLFDELDLLA
jgi:hypothetical protein